MAVQMYLVHPKHNEDDQARESIGELVANLQGFILMATSYGSLIIALDERYADTVRAHPQVEFVGGVTFNPDGPAAERLKRLFAQNVAAQLASRGMAGPGAGRPGRQPQPEAFPPGYRPLRWPLPEEEGGG